MRGATRRLAQRLVAALPPGLARPSARIAAFLLRDAGRTRRSVSTLSHALALVLDSGRAVTGGALESMTLGEIAAHLPYTVDDVAGWADRGLLGPPDDPGPPQRWRGALERARLVVYLLGRGVSLEALTSAAAEDRLPLLVVDRAIAGRGTLTVDQLCAAAGLPVHMGERVLRALGVAQSEPGEQLFGRRDVRAMRMVGVLRGLVDDDLLLDAIAVIGMAMGQVAAAETELFRIAVAQRLAGAGMGDLEIALRTAAMVDLLMPASGVLLDVAHRRLLEAAARSESVVRVEEHTGSLPGQEVVTVAFADLVGFTAVSERLSALALGELSARLLRAAEAVMPPHRARIVKSMGDAVMVAGRDAVGVTLAAVELVEHVGSLGGMPPLRVGVATGPALRRHADYFGRTVNIAARLCDLAPPDSVLVYCAGGHPPAALAAAGLRAGEPMTVRLRGLSRAVTAVLVERAGEDEAGGAAAAPP